MARGALPPARPPAYHGGMRLTGRPVVRFHDDGFLVLVLPHLFTPADVEALRAELPTRQGQSQGRPFRTT
jgi:hypothetical protein